MSILVANCFLDSGGNSFRVPLDDDDGANDDLGGLTLDLDVLFKVERTLLVLDVGACVGTDGYITRADGVCLGTLVGVSSDVSKMCQYWYDEYA